MSTTETTQVGTARLTHDQIKLIEQLFTAEFDSIPEQNIVTLQEVQDLLTEDLLERTEVSHQIDLICQLIMIKRQFKRMIKV